MTSSADPAGADDGGVISATGATLTDDDVGGPLPTLDPRDFLAAVLEHEDTVSNHEVTRAIIGEREIRSMRVKNCRLIRCEFLGTRLEGYAVLNDTKLLNCQFDVVARNLQARAARFVGVDMSRSRLETADLSGAIIKETVFDHADLEDANFANAEIERSRGYKARFAEATFSHSALKGCTFRGCTFEGAGFAHGLLADVAFLDNTSLVHADFSDALLERVRLDGADLDGADFTIVDAFHDVYLSERSLKDLQEPLDKFASEQRDEQDGRTVYRLTAHRNAHGDFVRGRRPAKDASE